MYLPNIGLKINISKSNTLCPDYPKSSLSMVSQVLYKVAGKIYLNTHTLYP